MRKRDGITVLGPPTVGFHIFEELEGNEIQLTKDEALKPHPMFLTEHRQLNGFNDD